MSSTNQCMLTPTPIKFEPRKIFQFQIMEPESCGDERAKVDNLKKQLAELNALIDETTRLAERIQLISKAKLVAAIVMESSISFLDLAAAMLEPINPQASQAAKYGVGAVRSVKATGDWTTGQTNASQFLGQVTSIGLSTAPTGKMKLGQKAMLTQAKGIVSSVNMGIDAASGVSKGDLKKDAIGMVTQQTSGGVELASDSFKDMGWAKTSATLNGLTLVEGVYTATIDYQDALDKHFDERLDDIQLIRSMKNEKTTLQRLVRHVEGKLTSALADLNACVLQEQNFTPVR